MTDQALYDQRVQEMADNIARNPDREAADLGALIAIDAALLYLVGRVGHRKMAEQLYRWADEFAVVPKRERR